MTQAPIAEFLAQLRRLDVQLLVEENEGQPTADLRLRCNAPAGRLTPELRQELASRKAEILAFLHPPQEAASVSLPPILPAAQEGPYPLSFAQQRLWFLYQLAPDNPFYNVPAAIRLRGQLDVGALEQAFNHIVCRHGALRTTFAIASGEAVQVVLPEAQVKLAVVDLQAQFNPSEEPEEAQRERLTAQLAAAEAQRPFNLSTDLPLRVTLLRFAPHESVLLLTLHHIVADGWSLGVLVQELASLYADLSAKQLPSLSDLPIQYTDFACWQRRWLEGEALQPQMAYWQQQLQDLPALELPTDHPRPSTQSYRGGSYPIRFSAALSEALEALSQKAGASLFMTLLAAFQVLLYRYTGQEDVAIGSPIANRHRSELEGLIGFFVNSLVLRTDLSGDPSFLELLARVRTVALEAYGHQDLPFEKLVETLAPERDLSRNPLFQVAFALQNAPMQPLQLPGLTLEPLQLEAGTTRFDLEVHLWEPGHGLSSLWQSQEGLSGFITYSTDLFERETIGRLVAHYQTLLEGIVVNPESRLSELPLLTPVERQQLKQWSRTSWPEFLPAELAWGGEACSLGRLRP
ncbi:MAG TPA: condensation domain-containing protein, partial [Trichocoleus sp.]